MQVCYAFKNVYSSLAEVTGMSVGRGSIDKTALEKVLSSSGVKVASEDVDAVARSLVRIESAATALCRSLSFEDTAEHFYRLLEGDPAGVDE
jgi:hypothetical protein